MKKLALALVCLVSLAFFASCDPTVDHPEPAISVLTGDGYLYDGCVADLDVYHKFGFQLASNALTNEPLAAVSVKVGNEEDGYEIFDDIDIEGDTYVYENEIIWSLRNREIIAEVEIICTVIDAAGKSNSASIKVSLNEEDNLEPVDFSWNRHGGQPGTGLEVFGLKWERNNKAEIYAVIEPINKNIPMYKFDAKVWDETKTAAQKAALFAEATNAIEQFNEVSCTAGNKDYDIVIGTVYNGEQHLIHITHSNAYQFKGTDVTITGQAK